MIRGELRNDHCRSCGSSLYEAKSVCRQNVIYRGGEFDREPGVALRVRCQCGVTQLVALSVDLRRVAARESLETSPSVESLMPELDATTLLGSGR